ncbi:MAG: DNA-binding transcriptional activator [Alistipes sp.]
MAVGAPATNRGAWVHIWSKSFYLLLLLIALLPAQIAAAQGLKFRSSELPIDQRTSYSVFADDAPTFTKSFDIEFDIALYQKTEIGYILRVKNEKSNIIYNLFYDAQGDKLTFKLNEEGKNCLISAEMARDELLNQTWFKLKIAFDLQKDLIRLTIGDQTLSAEQVGLPDKYNPRIIFGKSDHIIDVPTFAIRNLVVGDKTKQRFPLRESTGSVVHDESDHATGTVVNPEWLINDAYHWRFMTSCSSKTVAGTTYNPQKKEIYYYNANAISVFDVRTEITTTHQFTQKCPVHLALGTNFIDAAQNKLYAYEVYFDTPPHTQTTMASLCLTNYNWTAESDDQLPTQLHHHGAYFDPAQNRYTIFGGFGNMHFSKDFHTYDLANKTWQTRDSLVGDPLFPRYFSSVGYLKKNNSIYIFGGMGNESGEQVVGRRYFYDLHKVDLNTNRITKLWELAWNKDNQVPVRGMVVLDDDYFYTLCYPESISNSFLRLYRFSIKDGSYEILGDSIPIHSDKITTNANLYYDDQLNNLYATVQEFDDDIVSNLKVYSLAFPPITAEQLANWSTQRNHKTLITLLSLLVVCIVAGGYAVVRRRKSTATKAAAKALEADLVPEMASGGGLDVRANSIYLFGDFAAYDRHKKEITYMFSARQKQVLCLVLQHSDTEEGITSQRLSSLLWPDKAEDKVKNSRGVAINHLRKTLGELDGVELVYNKGCFKITQSAAFYCDYSRCMECLTATPSEAAREELIQIVGRGKFLKGADLPLFDSFKDATERTLEPALQLEMERSFEAEDYQAAIDLAESIFNIDPLNDNALSFQIRALQRLKMDEEARIRYQAFVAEYKKAFGQEYPQPFKAF